METCLRGSERGGWKRAARQRAGRLLYHRAPNRVGGCPLRQSIGATEQRQGHKQMAPTRRCLRRYRQRHQKIHQRTSATSGLQWTHQSDNRHKRTTNKTPYCTKCLYKYCRVAKRNALNKLINIWHNLSHQREFSDARTDITAHLERPFRAQFLLHRA